MREKRTLCPELHGTYLLCHRTLNGRPRHSALGVKGKINCDYARSKASSNWPAWPWPNLQQRLGEIT